MYLNIYRPREPQKKPLDVVVKIHGGGFYAGTNSPLLYGSEYFMETGSVVLVVIAYRLNVFGFLATGDEAAPGNYGLKDQTLALRWVKNHAAAFGGDPDSITILGQSAGAVSVNYHLVSRHSEGLYHRAIMLSGTVNAPWGKPSTRPRDVVNRHARALRIRNATQMDSKALVDLLRKIPAKNLTSTVRQLYAWDILPMAAYRPVVEPADIAAADAFLKVHPTVALERGDFVKVPVLTSIVHGDGINFVQPLVRFRGRYREFNKHMYRILPVLLEMDATHPNMTRIVDKIRLRYFGRRGLVTWRKLDSVLQMGTDYHFGRPLYATCQAMANHTTVFVHKFDYRGQKSLSLFFTRSLRNFGVVHADDVQYLFRVRLLLPGDLSELDRRVQRGFMRHLISFVQTGHPGYQAWNVTEPKITRFRKSTKKHDVQLDQVYANRHEFWREIQDMYEGR